MCELQFFAIVETMMNILHKHHRYLTEHKKVRLEINSAKGRVPKALVAPCALVDIAHCSKS